MQYGTTACQHYRSFTPSKSTSDVPYYLNWALRRGKKKNLKNGYLDLTNLLQNVRNPPESSSRWKQNGSQPAEHMQEPHS